MPKSKTQELPAMTGPGVERKSIKPLEKLADRIEDFKEQRKKLKEKLDADTEQLIIEMHSQNLQMYFTDNGKRIELDAKERVKITAADGVDDED